MGGTRCVGGNTPGALDEDDRTHDGSFDIKLDGGDLGSLLKRQARLVVKGFSQIKALHYFKVICGWWFDMNLSECFFTIVAAQGTGFLGS